MPRQTQKNKQYLDQYFITNFHKYELNINYQNLIEDQAEYNIQPYYFQGDHNNKPQEFSVEQQNQRYNHKRK
ncbi:hypothetical protein pb186bvf_020349 [Paramecium bursaria]